MDKRNLSERDICTKFITPALLQAGWTQELFREEVVTEGRILVKGHMVSRETRPDRQGAKWGSTSFPPRPSCTRRELPRTEQVTVQVARLLRVIGTRELGTGDLMREFDLSHRPTFLHNYLDPALQAGLIQRTDPGSPRSPLQKYCRTELGRTVVASPSKNRSRP